jgi:hypothetical protein
MTKRKKRPYYPDYNDYLRYDDVFETIWKNKYAYETACLAYCNNPSHPGQLMKNQTLHHGCFDENHRRICQYIDIYDDRIEECEELIERHNLWDEYKG